MTTKDSPQWKIHAQAERIAKELKAQKPGCNGKDHFKAGIVMDDKIITINFTWARVVELTEGQLVTLICALMREEMTKPKHGTVH